MTPDERQMLTDLANKFAQTPAPPKDPEAEEFIRTRIGSRPDALYVMTQTVLIQNIALQHAQEQIQQLQQKAGAGQQAATTGGFLGSAGTPPRSPTYSQPASAGAFAPPPSPAPQYAPPPQSGGSNNPSGAPSFLRGAAQTAAGVAAGALAFEGIRSLFSHPGYVGAGLGGFGGGYMDAPVEETVVNNYYDSPTDAGRDDYRGSDTGQSFADSDISNVDDSSQYDDSGNTDLADVGDGGGFDDFSGGDNFS